MSKPGEINEGPGIGEIESSGKFTRLEVGMRVLTDYYIQSDCFIARFDLLFGDPLDRTGKKKQFNTWIHAGGQRLVKPDGVDSISWSADVEELVKALRGLADVIERETRG